MHKSYVYHLMSFDKCVRLCDPAPCQDGEAESFLVLLPINPF